VASAHLLLIVVAFLFFICASNIKANTKMEVIRKFTYEIMVGGVKFDGENGGLACQNYTSLNQIIWDMIIMFAVGLISIICGCLLTKAEKTKCSRAGAGMKTPKKKAKSNFSRRHKKSRDENIFNTFWKCLLLVYVILNAVHMAYKWSSHTMIWIFAYCNLLSLVQMVLLAARQHDSCHTLCRTVLNISMYQVYVPAYALWSIKPLIDGLSVVEAILFIIRHGLLIVTPSCLISQFGTSRTEQYPISLCWVFIQLSNWNN